MTLVPPSLRRTAWRFAALTAVLSAFTEWASQVASDQEPLSVAMASLVGLFIGGLLSFEADRDFQPRRLWARIAEAVKWGLVLYLALVGFGVAVAFIFNPGDAVYSIDPWSSGSYWVALLAGPLLWKLCRGRGTHQG